MNGLKCLFVCFRLPVKDRLGVRAEEEEYAKAKAALDNDLDSYRAAGPNAKAVMAAGLNAKAVLGNDLDEDGDDMGFGLFK